MIASGQTLADGFGCAVSQQKTGVVSEHRIADGGLNTDTGSASGENQGLDRTALKNAVEIGLEKSAVSVLVENDVAGFGRQVRYDLRIPRVSNENPACRSVWSSDYLTRAQGPMLNPVWGIGATSI